MQEPSGSVSSGRLERPVSFLRADPGVGQAWCLAGKSHWLAGPSLGMGSPLSEKSLDPQFPIGVKKTFCSTKFDCIALCICIALHLHRIFFFKMYHNGAKGCFLEGFFLQIIQKFWVWSGFFLKEVCTPRVGGAVGRQGGGHF